MFSLVFEKIDKNHGSFFFGCDIRKALQIHFLLSLTWLTPLKSRGIRLAWILNVLGSSLRISASTIVLPSLNLFKELDEQ